MEIVIVICLVVVILLLLSDKIVIKKIERTSQNPVDTRVSESDIMGISKYKGQSLPKADNESHKDEPQKSVTNFEPKINEEPDEAPQAEVDLQEEEEELSSYSEPGVDFGFATGVSFEELGAMQVFISKTRPTPIEQQAATLIAQKIEGTELVEILESSLPEASGKIAALLDKHLSAETDPGSSTSSTDFDIGHFV